MTRLDRAACLAQGGDAPGAVAYAIETVSGLNGEQRRGIIAGRGHELVRALPVKYKQAAAVGDFEALLLQSGVEPKGISGQ